MIWALLTLATLGVGWCSFRYHYIQEGRQAEREDIREAVTELEEERQEVMEEEVAEGEETIEDIREADRKEKSKGIRSLFDR